MFSRQGMPTWLRGYERHSLWTVPPMPLKALFGLLVLVMFLGGNANAIVPPFNDKLTGIACDWYDSATKSRWQRRQGDWQDARGQDWGDYPFGQPALIIGNTAFQAKLDVTPLVQLWLERKAPNQGILLKVVDSQLKGPMEFFSREAAESVRPVMELQFTDGSRRFIYPSADATLDCSTYKGLGGMDRLVVSTNRHAAFFFDVTASKPNTQLNQALLRLTVARRYGDLRLGAFRLMVPVLDLPPPDAPPETGLASKYLGDKGLENDPNVLLFEGFEGRFWKQQWSDISSDSDYTVVQENDEYGYWPLQGKVLRVRIAKGKQLGLNLSYRFSGKINQEPEEIYFRYYLYLGADWNPIADGGKLPGISGDYGKAGWGGRRADGRNGWSLRGAFLRTSTQQEGGLLSFTQLATYAYHADMATAYGDDWLWSYNNWGLLRNLRWYCIEQYVRLNTPGKNDGVLKVWIDGRRTLDKRDIRFRDTEQLKIERVWMNVFHGGTATSHQDQHLYIDSVVVARQYIGPMRSPTN